MQIPPAENIPPMPDENNPGPIPPMGPDLTEPDEDDDFPPPEDDPGDAPDLPPRRDPFPDDVNPAAEHPQSL